MARVRDPLTKDLFDWQPPRVAVTVSPEITGRGRLDNRIARLVGHALRDAREERSLTRPAVAREMSDYLGRTISEAMLNKWSSEGSEDHRIPLDAFMALIDATGARGLLGFMPGEFGLTVIETEYADLIEERLIEEQIDELQARRQALSLKRRARR